MNIIQRITSFFKNIFSSKHMIALPSPSEILDDTSNYQPDFLDSLKIQKAEDEAFNLFSDMAINNTHKEKTVHTKHDTIKPAKNVIKTLVCVGDGLGIQTKIEY